MDSIRFDQIARMFVRPGSRRQTVLALALGSLPLLRWHDGADAGPGCANVGKTCERDSDCCSNRCRTKKGKKTCRGHDARGCKPGQIETFCGGKKDVACITKKGVSGLCNTTTGNAAYCSADGLCVPCKTDLDCEEEGFGKGAACVRCDGCADGRGCASRNNIEQTSS